MAPRLYLVSQYLEAGHVHEDDVGVGPLLEDSSALQVVHLRRHGGRLLDTLLQREQAAVPHVLYVEHGESAEGVDAGEGVGRVLHLPLGVEYAGVQPHHALGVGVVLEGPRTRLQLPRDSAGVRVLGDDVHPRVPLVGSPLLGDLPYALAFDAGNLALEDSYVLGPPGVRIGVVAHSDEPLATAYRVLDLLPEVVDLEPFGEGLAASQLPEPGRVEAAEVGHHGEAAACHLGNGVPGDVEVAAAFLHYHVYGGFEVGRLQLVGRRRVYLPARAQVGVVEPDAGLLVYVDTLHEGGDLLVGHVARGDTPASARPPPVGAVDPAILLEHRDAVDDLLVGGEDVGVVVEARAHAYAAVLHGLMDVLPHLGLLLRSAVTLVVEAHHSGPDAAVADERRVVHAYARLLDPLEVACHGVPVELPAEVLLHPLVYLLQRIVGKPRVVLVWV